REVMWMGTDWKILSLAERRSIPVKYSGRQTPVNFRIWHRQCLKPICTVKMLAPYFLIATTMAIRICMSLAEGTNSLPETKRCRTGCTSMTDVAILQNVPPYQRYWKVSRA